MTSEAAERIRKKARESSETIASFFDREAERIAECAGRISERFERGGRLFAMGNGGSACDAEHIAVEMLHPVLEKRPALPAFCLSTGSALMSAVGNDEDFSLLFAKQLRLLAQPDDIALGISTSGKSANVTRALKVAREMGLLSVGFAGRDGGAIANLADYVFVVPSFSIHRIQEAHVVLLHVLWDMIHVARGAEDVL